MQSLLCGAHSGSSNDFVIDQSYQPPACSAVFEESQT